MVYADKAAYAATIDSEKKLLDYPAAPKVEDKTFNHWEPVAEEITENKTITIKAVYSE